MPEQIAQHPFLFLAVLAAVYAAWRGLVRADAWLTDRMTDRGRAIRREPRVDQETLNLILRAEGFTAPLPDGKPGLRLVWQG